MQGKQILACGIDGEIAGHHSPRRRLLNQGQGAFCGVDREHSDSARESVHIAAQAVRLVEKFPIIADLDLTRPTPAIEASWLRHCFLDWSQGSLSGVPRENAQGGSHLIQGVTIP